MTEKVNVPRSIKDPNYRYQMPLLQQKIEGKGLNIHTTLLNLKEVAKALRTSYEYILKFIGYELSLQVNDNSNKISINGEINNNDILKVLDRFIQRYILCTKCGLPEMFITIPGNNEKLVGVCYSCGKLSKIDQTHKLSTYIFRFPPQNQSEFKKLTTGEFDFAKIIESGQKEDEFRKEIARQLREKDALPFSDDSKELFDKVQDYLRKGFSFGEKYEFKDSHVEVVYKLIKRLRLPKEKWDRIGYILFNFIFSNETIREVDSRGLLFIRVLERHGMRDFIPHELLLNFQAFHYKRYAHEDNSARISTRVVKFYDAEFIDQELLKEVVKSWKEGTLENLLERHILFRKTFDDRFKVDCHDFLNYISSEDEEVDEVEDED